MKPRAYRLVFTDKRCRIAGKSRPDMPLIIGPDGRYAEPATSYLRWRYLRGRQAASSVGETAKHLVQYFNRLHDRGLGWDEGSDRFFMEWRDDAALDCQPAQKNTLLASALSFCVWAERHDHTKGKVAMPKIGQDYVPNGPVTVEIGQTKDGRVKYLSPFRLKTVKSRPRRTPTDREIGKLHDAALARPTGELACLLYTLVEISGARRGDLRQLCVSQLPTRSACQQAQAEGRVLHFEVVRKGGKRHWLAFLPQHVEEIRDFVEGYRAAIVAKFSSRGGYVDPDFIFLSQKTGEVLELNSISDLAIDDFERADVKGVSLHRIRAKFARALADVLRAEGMENDKEIFGLIAEVLGQSSLGSLAVYLGEKMMRESTTDALRSGMSAVQSYVSLKAKIIKSVQQIRRDGRFHNVAAAAEGGDVDARRTLVEMIANELFGEEVLAVDPNTVEQIAAEARSLAL